MNRQAPSSTQPKPPTARNTRAIIFALISAAIYVYLLYAVPAFRDLFQGFGADLPTVTRLLLDYYPVVLILLIGTIFLVVALVYSKTTNNYALLQHLDHASSWNLALSVACSVLAMIAVYLPIFRLGANV